MRRSFNDTSDASKCSPARAPDRAPAAVPDWASSVAVMLQYSAARKAIRSRSRSTMSRLATLWTRPAESRGATLRQSTGETS